MKKIFLIGCLIVTYFLHAQVKEVNDNHTFYDFLNLYKSKNADTIPNKHIQRLAKRWVPRLSPSGDCKIAANAIQNYAQSYASNYSYEPNWEEIGPIGTSSTSQIMNGRIDNLIFDPNYGIGNNKTIYACSGYGGLWRTENDGGVWDVVNTDVGIPTSGVSDLAIHPVNANILFLTTGNADNGLLVYGTRAGSPNPIFSTGIYRSLDYGNTWHAVNTGLENSLQNRMNIREIEINPTNPNQIFIATDIGVFRTNNAMATQPIWTEMFTGVGSFEDTEFKGLEFKPDNHNIIYTSGKDIYRSIDNGTIWQSMTGVGTGLDFTNLPNGFEVGRINITTTPAANERVYAYIYGTETSGIARIYIYMFNGVVWNILRDFTTTSAYETITWNRLAIAVSPTNPEEVYYGTTKLYGNSDIESSSFVSLSPYNSMIYGGYHADIHSLEFPPNSDGSKLFCGNEMMVEFVINLCLPLIKVVGLLLIMVCV